MIEPKCWEPGIKMLSLDIFQNYIKVLFCTELDRIFIQYTDIAATVEELQKIYMHIYAGYLSPSLAR